MRPSLFAPFFVLAAVGACSGDGAAAREDPLSAPADREPVASSTPPSTPPADPIVSDLIDPDIPPAVAGEAGWDYMRIAEVDLTGDGEPELAVLTARVEIYRGQPAWDDGQPWQVYVEDVSGHRTYLYARRLQLGQLTMRVTAPEDGSHPSIVLIEHLPDRLAIYESVYTAPNSVITYDRFTRTVDPRGDTASPEFP